MYLDTKELLCIEFPEKGPGGNAVYPWHSRG